jgi:hypothetical protein
MSKLWISESLSLPLDAVTQKFAFLGRTGSGKSYGSTKLCELMLDAKAQVVALDPVGVWWGLRVGADGREAYSIPVFGGLHGDIPLEPGAGALIADLIVDRNISAVLDVSNFLMSEQRKFATDFATQLFQKKKTQRSAMHVFFEEAQEFVPQQVRGDVARMVGAFERLIKLGRNFGIGATLISQRPQAVNKDVLNQTECLFAFQMTGPQERKAIESWVAEKGVNEDIGSVLPHLKVGDAHVWSPQWLQISETIRIAKKTTADVSSTPKPGAKVVEPKQLSQIELEDLSEKMLATIERAKADDPKELRKTIDLLKRQVQTGDSYLNRLVDAAGVEDELEALEWIRKAKRDLEKGKTEIKRVEVPVLAANEIARLEKLCDRVERVSQPIEALHADLRVLLRRTHSLIGVKQAEMLAPKALDVGDGAIPRVGAPGRASGTREQPSRLSRNEGNVTTAGKAQPPATGVQFTPTPKQQQILDALAWFESIGIPSPSTLQIGAVALIDASGGHFSNVVGPLSSNGLVQRGGGSMSLTPAGRELARVPENVASLADYHEVLRSRVRKVKNAGGKTVEILNAVIGRRGAEITTQEIGEEVGIDPTGGHFSNMIGPLSTLGFIERSHGVVRPTEILFPPGLS